ncbi:MAG: TlpA family protein disulfide reductase [Candidatus Thermoplasmatota archaeon]|nr:TlpA family protein disulfide reductase [Candidatus Thermoplasmatota archaeon]
MNVRKSLTAGLAALCLALPAAAADLPPLSHSLTMQAPKPAPALKLVDLDGKPHDLARLKGKVVLINFWATWCPPCRREMPSMERLSQALAGEPFVVLAIDVGEDADTIDAFTGQLDTTPTFPVLLDTRSRTLPAWKVAGLPTTFLVDQRGRIVASAIGGREFDHPDIVRVIQELLRK